ncbi:hypothetical protein KI440_01045 [Candidatus Saccharibacteria bacterium TM7i]|nr:hypothetical protein KI440_01045 [Candidatus Saccharibacteria bacterium TM7i]
MNLEADNKKRRRNNRLLWAIPLALALVAGAVFGGMAIFGNPLTAQPAFAADSKGLHTVEFNPKKDAIPEEALCTTDTFVDHSLRTVKAGNAEKRQFGTAVSIPFTGKDDVAVTKEILAENCGNPTFLEMNLKEMQLWDDKSIPGAESNKGWISEVQKDIEANGLNSFVKNLVNDKDEVQKRIVTEQYQMYASWANTVLLRFNDEGKHSLTSVRNWEQPGTWDPSKGLPSVQQAKDQESKPAWVRVLTDKNDKCLIKIGFNAEDRRIELFHCVEPEKPKPSETPKSPKPNPECTENCGPPPCTVDCGPPPCTVDCGPVVEPKDPSQDPYQQGNAPDGGGQNNDPGPGAPTTPTQPPSTPRENPPPPVAPPPAAKPDPTPPPAPEPKAPEPKAPETGCVPMPGVSC